VGRDRINASTAEAWLEKLPALPSQFQEADVWLAQLGADPYIHDPLGGVLTLEQLHHRDSIVFQGGQGGIWHSRRLEFSRRLHGKLR